MEPDMPTVSDLDQQIADLENQIAQAQQGGQVPDYSAFYKSPGYDFRMQEGINALDKSAAARGKLMSGGLMRELERYGQGLASSEFNNYANRLASLAGVGQTATNTGINAGQASASGVANTSANIGQNLMNAGTANASGIVGASNAFQSGLQDASGFLGNIDWGQIFSPSLQQQAYADVNNPAYSGIF